MDFSPVIGLVLVISGVIVGFINTLAGGATIISITTFMVLGLPLPMANGTNRVPVVLQNLTSCVTFFRKRLLDMRTGVRLAVPTIVGNVAGSQIASTVDEGVFRICLGVVLLMVLGFMAFSSEKRLKGSGERGGPIVIRPWHYVWFLAIGFYSGYIYVGLGYLILAVAMMSMKLDLVRANALKGFIVLVSTPFALAVFILNGQVNYLYGLVHAVGNVIGAYVASAYAVGWGVRFLRLFMVVVTIVCLADVLELISLREMILSVLRA